MKISNLILAISFTLIVFTHCSKSETSSTASSNTTSGTSSNTSTSTGTVGNTGVSAVTPSVPTACASKTGMAKIVCLCDEFKASLSSTQQTSLQLTYTFDNIKTWSNLPASMSARKGIKLGDLTSAQVAIAKALVKEISGTAANEGYDEVQQLWLADDYLNANGGGSTYGSGNFYIAFFGTPALTGQFEIMMTGHHKTIANTYKDGVLISGTPHFTATEPLTWTSSNISYLPMNQEQAAFVALLAGLTSTQLTTAKSSKTFSDLLLKPGNEWQFPSTYSGLQCNALSDAQKTLVLNAIKTYTSDLDDASATSFYNKYAADIDNTYITYSGTTALNTKNDYISIYGPNVSIEFSVQGGVILSGVHYHSIWRDKINDYGTTK